MSIVPTNDGYAPTCDGCGYTLEPTDCWDDAADAMKEDDWYSYQDKHGDYQDLCPDCHE